MMDGCMDGTDKQSCSYSTKNLDYSDTGLSDNLLTVTVLYNFIFRKASLFPFSIGYHCKGGFLYRARKKSLYVVGRLMFLLFLNCSAWLSLGPA